jgi:hypothetical protein
MTRCISSSLAKIMLGLTIRDLTYGRLKSLGVENLMNIAGSHSLHSRPSASTLASIRLFISGD